jgi:intergrase/recombinase
MAKTLKYLEENHELYYLIYKLILESGLRMSHALLLIESFSLKELVEIPGVGLETTRLVCFNNKGFCRYYIGIRESQKPCEWAYFSTKTLKLLEEYAGERVNRNSARKDARRNGLLPPKYMRKVAWNLMIKAMPREVEMFIQSRFRELKILETRYEDLLSEADGYYPKFLEMLS